MTSRFALTAIVALVIVLAAWAQQDFGPFNRFAIAYNAYVTIDARIQDSKALRRMRAAWRDLVKSQGWPQEPCKAGE